MINHLECLGINFEHLNFPDHHNFTSKEFEKFNSYDLVLTTEKDFVRLEDKVPAAFYLGIKHAFLFGGRKI